VSCSLIVVGCAEETLQGVEFVCQSDAECNDQDPCTQDSCAADGFSCKNLSLEDGDICDGGSFAGICLAGACGESICGDGYVDDRLNPAEQCDDGNTLDDDGCAADCTHDAPDLIIDFPNRGETFDGDTTLTVLGRVDDKGVGVDALYVNGETVEVKVDGSFEHEMSSVQGLNKIDARVLSLGGKEDTATRGYYYSTQWWDAPLVEEEAMAGLGDRIEFRLGQEAFDDFDHPCSTVDGVYVCDEVDDLATVGEIILNDLSVDDFGGSIGLYEEELELLNQTIPMSLPPIEIEGVGTITLSGDIGLFGGVVMKSEVIELDMNEVGLRLEARDGGLDADVSIDSNVEGPGFTATVRTSATVNIEARFTNVSAVLETSFITLNSLDLVCLFIPPGPPFNTICPATAGGPLAPLGALEPDPTAWVDSGLAIERMLMETGFNIQTTEVGSVDVQLVNGTIDMLGGQVDLTPVQDIQIDLGGVSILGGLEVFDLGQVDLSLLASGITVFTDGVLGLFLNDLQFLLEPAVNLLLLNPSDPLSVGDVVEDFIMGMSTSGPLALGASLEAGLPSPELTLDTQISSLSFRAPESGDLRTGGMFIGFETKTASERGTVREPLGSLVRSCEILEEDVWNSGYSMDAMKHLDVVNQGLFSAFWTGELSGSVPTSFAASAIENVAGLERITASLTPMTSPILNDCGGDLRLEWADMQVAGTMDENGVETDFTGFVSASIPVMVEVNLGVPELKVDPARAKSMIWEVTGGEASTEAPQVLPEGMEALCTNFALEYADAVITALPGVAFDLAAMFDIERGAAVVMEPALVETVQGVIKMAGQPMPDGVEPSN
ncbi:MAG: DUF4215 domain-containing protein, partial [Deltaproteobacteria bacterium]|nr:DUF4215 domain-containing protein [Deltaproteobacteria bacterium]